MKICYVLPAFTRQPIGGYKIVFEYANRLASAGYDVSILFLNDDVLKKYHLPKKVKPIIANYLTKIEPTWFPLDKKVLKISNLEKNYTFKLREIDVVFATGVETVETVLDLFSNSRKFYFIQGYENWHTDESYLHKTYSENMTNIVVSNWLKRKVDFYGKAESILISNPIDIKKYRVTNPIESRSSRKIGILYHQSKMKGLDYSIAALKVLKERFSDLQVEMFGTPKRPQNLPAWVNYTRGASQSETIKIYNKVSVFLSGAIEEGFGLTGLEAMACGAALVSTNYSGVKEYAVDGVNALLSPVENVDGLVENVSMLFLNEKKRIELAQNGVLSAKKFSWDRAISQLRIILEDY
ncbi:glycosyltransferase family 4 protein [Enterococcus sp. LJL90]